MEKKICTKCNEELEIILFNFKNKNKNIRRSDCKECFKKLTREHYKNNKEYYLNRQKSQKIRNKNFILEYLKQSKCVDCGMDDWRILEFDHVRGVKKDCISAMIGSKTSIYNIKLEIDKCEVRCPNCHRLITFIRENNYRISSD